VRILSVRGIGVPGFAQPTVGAVEFVPVALDQFNFGPWPPKLTLGHPSNGRIVTAESIVGRDVILATGNTLVLGVRTPVAHRVYPLAGITVTYLHDGHRYVAVIRDPPYTNVMCPLPATFVTFPQWCSIEAQAAQAIEDAFVPVGTVARSTPFDERYVAAIFQVATFEDVDSQRPTTVGELRSVIRLVNAHAAGVTFERVTLSHAGVFRVTLRSTGQRTASRFCVPRDVIQNHGVVAEPPRTC
jgi:hypothetical protein